jgi:subtilisin family serine protease
MFFSAAKLGRQAVRLMIAIAVVAAVAGPSIGSADAPTSQLLVSFSPGASATEQANALAAVGATETGAIPDIGVKVVSVPEQAADGALRGLQHNQSVSYAEKDATVAPSDVVLNDFRWRDSWALPIIHAPKAWSVTTGDPKVVVAVLDSGVDFQQPDLQGAFVPGRDILNNDADPSDDNGHGTGAAGVVAARSDNGVGVTSICGGCSIMPVKIAGSDGYATWSAMASGITWAVDHGARILSISFASPAGSTTVASAISYARSHNALVFVSAGNYSSSSPYYPAAYPGAIAVAATGQSDALESYSNYGSWVQIAAPGCNYSTNWTSKYPSDPYDWFCGTSSSAPAAAAVAALALSYAPATTADQLEQALYAGAVNVRSFVKYGRVDAWNTLASLGASSASAPSAPAPRVGEEPVVLSWPGNPLSAAPQAGQILAASSGGWTGAVPLAFTWTWTRCDSGGANCQVVSSSTSSTYTVSTADSGYSLRATLTATNASGSASSASTPTLPVGGSAATVTAPAVTALPSISGTPQDGSTLTASTGTWNGSPTTYAYQWQRCDTSGGACSSIASASSSSYALTSVDVGSTLRIAVTASNTAGSSTAVSAATSIVAAAASTAPTSTSTTFTGALNGKQTTQSFAISLPTGTVRANLSFAKCSQLSLNLRTGGASLASRTGPSVVSLGATTTAASYSFVVSGAVSKGSCSFTLTVTATS